MLEDENGTHQIGHIVLSNYGIFVIEMKNYYGLIRGREYDNKWCQYLGRKKSYFMNPIHQNYGHIKCLENLLKLEEKNFISIVCFSNQAKLKIENKSIVTQTDLLIKEILKYNEKTNDYNLEHLFVLIENKNIKDRNMRKAHVNLITDKVHSNELKISQMICPSCGSKLVKKRGRRGYFIGCSNYPKCHFTNN